MRNNLPCVSLGDAMLPASLGALSLGTAPNVLLLPRPLVLAIFALIPVDTRLRCSEVSRAWRALLTDTTFRERLAFSTSGLVTARFEELFVAAVAKAGGQLCELDVSDKFAERQYLTQATLVAAVAANLQTLQRLRLCSSDDFSVPHDTVAELCDAAPGLQVEAKVSCLSTENRTLLRREPPFSALNLIGVEVDFAPAEENLFSSFLFDLRHRGASLTSICFYSASIPGLAAFKALVDAAIFVHLASSISVDKQQPRPVVCARICAPVVRGEHFSAVYYGPFSERRAS